MVHSSAEDGIHLYGIHSILLALFYFNYSINCGNLQVLTVLTTDHLRFRLLDGVTSLA